MLDVRCLQINFMGLTLFRVLFQYRPLISNFINQVDNKFYEEIERLRDENAYLTSLIKSLVPNNFNSVQSTTTSSPLTIKSQNQSPLVLNLKETKSNSKFIVPIYRLSQNIVI